MFIMFMWSWEIGRVKKYLGSIFMCVMKDYFITKKEDALYILRTGRCMDFFFVKSIDE